MLRWQRLYDNAQSRRYSLGKFIPFKRRQTPAIGMRPSKNSLPESTPPPPLLPSSVLYGVLCLEQHSIYQRFHERYGRLHCRRLGFEASRRLGIYRKQAKQGADFTPGAEDISWTGKKLMLPSFIRSNSSLSLLVLPSLLGKGGAMAATMQLVRSQAHLRERFI